MKILGVEETLTELLQERTYSWIRLKAHPLTVDLANDFVLLHEDWLRILMEEIKLTENLAAADALIAVTDDELDIRFMAVVNTILSIVYNDRSAPLFKRFLGNERPAELKAPVLGEQLETMRSWPLMLAASGIDVLQSHGIVLGPLIEKADSAVNEERKAAQELKDFNEIGERKAFIDRFNALRRLTFNRLTEISQKHPELNLPSDFAEQFFSRDARSHGPTIANETRIIQRLEEQLKKHKALRQKLQERKQASDQARVEAEHAVLEQELERLERETVERQARVAELKAKLAKSRA